MLAISSCMGLVLMTLIFSLAGTCVFALEKTELNAMHEEWLLDQEEGPVKSVDRDNREYFCVETSDSVTIQELESVVQKRLDLKGKGALFRFFKKKDSEIKSLTMHGWQSLPYRVRNGSALSFGCVDSSDIEKSYIVESDVSKKHGAEFSTIKTQQEGMPRANAFIDQLGIAGCDKKVLNKLKKLSLKTGDMEALGLVTEKIMECDSNSFE